MTYAHAEGWLGGGEDGDGWLGSGEDGDGWLGSGEDGDGWLCHEHDDDLYGTVHGKRNWSVWDCTLFQSISLGDCVYRIWSPVQ